MYGPPGKTVYNGPLSSTNMARVEDRVVIVVGSWAREYYACPVIGPPLCVNTATFTACCCPRRLTTAAADLTTALTLPQTLRQAVTSRQIATPHRAADVVSRS